MTQRLIYYKNPNQSIEFQRVPDQILLDTFKGFQDQVNIIFHVKRGLEDNSNFQKRRKNIISIKK